MESCWRFGIPETDVEVVDDPWVRKIGSGNKGGQSDSFFLDHRRLQDGMDVVWEPEVVSEIVRDRVKRHKIDTVSEDNRIPIRRRLTCSSETHRSSRLTSTESQGIQITKPATPESGKRASS